MPKPKMGKEQGKGRVSTEKKRHIFMQRISILGYIGFMHIVLMKLTIGMHHKLILIMYPQPIEINKPGENNISFANNAFSFIKDSQRNNEKVYVIIGDFTDFFDSLNHKCLKERLQLVFKSRQIK